MRNQRTNTRICKLATAVVFATVVSFSNGCASMNAFSNGKKQLDRGELDSAVASFRNAHELDPNNERYFKIWCETTDRVVEWHYNESTSRHNEQMLSVALSHVDQALNYCDSQGEPIPGQPSKQCRTACGLPKDPPHHPHSLRGVISFDESKLIDLRDKVVRAIAEASERTDAGEAQMTAELWDDAVRTLRHATELDRSSERARTLLNQAVDGAVQHHLKLAREHLDTEAWDSCRYQCDVVDSYRPDNADAQLIRKNADDRQKARAFQSRASQAVADQEYISAVSLLEEAAPLWPEDASIAAALVNAKNLAADALLVEARSQLAIHDYKEAVRSLDHAKLLAPSRSDILSVVSEAEIAWADSLLEEGRNLFANASEELAWIRTVRATSISRHHRPAREDFDRYTASIREKLRCTIAVLPISHAEVPSNETLRACELITTALRAQAPSHLHIIERSRLSDVLSEHDLASADLLKSAGFSRIASRLKNADLILFVSTATRNNDGQEVEQWGSVTYVAGTKLVPNPAYANAQAEVSQAHQELQNARGTQLAMSGLGFLLGQSGKMAEQLLGAGARGAGNIGARQAEERYNIAVARANQTPQMIMVPDERQYKYPVCRITRNATVTVAIRLVDVATGEVLWNQDSLAHTVTQSDTYVKAEPQYGVPGKQAMLSSAKQLYAEACEHLKGDIHAACQVLLCRRSESYLVRARSSSSPSESLTHYVHYLFDPGPKPSSDTINTVLSEIIADDIDDVRRDRGLKFIANMLALPLRSAPMTSRENYEGNSAPQSPHRERSRTQQGISLAAAPSEALRVTLYDKRKLDKYEAFGLRFDVEDVNKDGVDIRVRARGEKSKKFEGYHVGHKFEVDHVHVRVVECDPDEKRAVIDIWEEI